MAEENNNLSEEQLVSEEVKEARPDASESEVASDSPKVRKAKTKDEKQKEARKKQLLILAIILGIALIMGTFLDEDEKQKKVEIDSASVVQIKDPELNENTIVNRFNRDIKDLQEKQKQDREILGALKTQVESLKESQEQNNETVKNALSDINHYLRKLESKLGQIEKRARMAPGVRAAQDQKPIVKLPEPEKPSFKLPTNPPAPKEVKKDLALDDTSMFDEAFGEDIADEKGKPSHAPAKSGLSPVNKGVYTAADDQPTQNIFVGDTKEEESEEINPFVGYLSPGFVNAAILTGVSANTSQTAASDPAPVMMRIQGNVQLAGGAKYKLKDCFVFGSATGNMSEERAHIRLVNVSCVDKDNKRVLEGKIKGYVVDSDGIFGVRGKLVERRSDVLRNMFLAGGLEGLSSVGATASSSGLQVGGMTSGPGLDPGAIFGSSAMKGFSSAAGKLADFYLKEAQAMFPVVEVPPGRKITLVVVEGTQLLWRDVSKTHVKTK